MAITLTITESDIEKIAGIPSYLIVESNVPCNIFYTLDGTEPTVDSSIYIDQIKLPTVYSKVTVKIFATNGLESTTVYTSEYGTSFVGLDPGSSTILNYSEQRAGKNYAPFGDMLQEIPPIFGPAAGLIIDDASIPNALDGYDAYGNQVGSIDEGLSGLLFTYSETDVKGNVGRGIGTLPQSTILERQEDPQYSSVNDKFFNPKAQVIFQSYEDTENQDITPLNRQSFSFANQERLNGGANHYVESGTLQAHGQALRQHFNPKDSTITYYYFDSVALKWLISKEKYIPKISNNYAETIPVSRANGAGLVFKWFPFMWKRII
jgi:hypothetical protein